jgi:hypothetical protein
MSGGGAPEVEITAAERALSRDAAEKYNDYQQNFVPLENSFIAQLTPTKGEAQAQRGAATSDVAQSAKGTDQKIVAGSKGAGGQGKSIIARAGVSTRTGTARGEAVTGMDRAMRNKELSGLTKMAAFGRGLQDQNSTSLRSAASDASSMAINKANIEAQDDRGLGTLVGAAAGTYLGQKDNVDILKKKFSFGGPKKLS